ncbi:MAG TPA: hypothetical protein VIQ30_00570 [Pseudonocardia sp.]|jgi:hypothetical protein
MSVPIAAPAATPPGAVRAELHNVRLSVAEDLLRNPSILPPGVSARSCTWLIRLALERAMDEFWAGHAPPIRTASRRAQLLVFNRTINADLGQRYSQLWSELSNAAHHHAYELAPTAGELRTWHNAAHAVITALEAIPARDPARSPRSGVS